VTLPGLPAEYAATLVRSDGDRTRIALRSDRRRVETEFKDGRRHIVIARGDLGVGWVWQDSDPWLETPLDWRAVAGGGDPSQALSWTEAGMAEIDGQPCRHFVGSPDGSGGVQQECFVLSSGIRRRTVSYRTDGTVGIVIDCLDVLVGPPPPEVFELPAGANVARDRRSRSKSGGRGHPRR
jgi:hypothetical protein